MEASKIVIIVERIVIKAEFPKERQKSIFFIASGKFFKVNPWEPISARGSDVISAFVLNTLTTTKINGKMKQTNNTINITMETACRIFRLRAAFSFKSSIMLTPPLSYQCIPEVRLQLHKL